MWHPKQLKKINWRKVYVTFGEQTLQHNVTQKCQISEQGLYDDHTIF